MLGQRMTTRCGPTQWIQFWPLWPFCCLYTQTFPHKQALYTTHSYSTLLHPYFNTPNGKKKSKSEWMLQKITNMNIYVPCFSHSFHAWRNLLKFDTAVWNSYHWSIYYASAKVESSSTVISKAQTFFINKLDLRWHRILAWTHRS